MVAGSIDRFGDLLSEAADRALLGFRVLSF
jgi:hypothetical protein